MQKLSDYALKIIKDAEEYVDLSEEQENFIMDVDAFMEDYWYFISENTGVIPVFRKELFTKEYSQKIDEAVEVLRDAFNQMDILASLST